MVDPMMLEVNMVVESAKKVVNDSKVDNKTNVVKNNMVIDNTKLVEVSMILVVTMEDEGGALQAPFFKGLNLIDYFGSCGMGTYNNAQCAVCAVCFPSNQTS